MWGQIQVLVLKPLCTSSTGKAAKVGSRQPHYFFLNPVYVQTSRRISHCPGNYLGMKICKSKLFMWICEVSFHYEGRTEFESLHVPSVVALNIPAPLCPYGFLHYIYLLPENEWWLQAVEKIVQFTNKGEWRGSLISPFYPSCYYFYFLENFSQRHHIKIKIKSAFAFYISHYLHKDTHKQTKKRERLVSM